MPLGGMLPYAPQDDFNAPVVLDSGDINDGVSQDADGDLAGMGEEGILALIRKLSMNRGKLMPGGAPPSGSPAQMPEMNGQVQGRMPQAPGGGGMGRALLSGFRG